MDSDVYVKNTFWGNLKPTNTHPNSSYIIKQCSNQMKTISRETNSEYGWAVRLGLKSFWELTIYWYTMDADSRKQNSKGQCYLIMKTEDHTTNSKLNVCQVCCDQVVNQVGNLLRDPEIQSLQRTCRHVNVANLQIRLGASSGIIWQKRYPQSLIYSQGHMIEKVILKVPHR